MASLRSSSLPKTMIRSLDPCRQRSLRYSTSHNHSTTHLRAHVQHGRIKGSHVLTVALSASCLAFTLGALYPPSIATLVSPRPAPGPPDPSEPSSKAYVEELEQQLQSLSLLAKLRSSPDANEWYETRPYEHVPEEHRVNSLTAGALRGPGKLALLPLLRAKTDETESIVFMHFGRGLCGHDGIIHGGLIATILDESLGRQAIRMFPDKIAVTATLTIDYKAPTKADQFVVLRTRLIELKGRKAVLEGSIEDLDGTILATARGLFIQPKYAKLLNTRLISKIVGEPPVAAARLAGGDLTPTPED